MTQSKIILVNPEINKKSYYGAWSDFIYPFMPSSLLNIGAFLKTQNIDVRIFDFRVEENFLDFINLINRFQPDFICFTSLTFMLNDIFFAAKEIKKINSKITTLVTGYNAFANPQDLINNPNINYAIKDETGKTMAELIKALVQQSDPSHVANICFLKENNIFCSNTNNNFPDLDYLPTPSMDLDMIAPEKYWNKSNIPWAKRFISLYASTGCAFSCNFCLNSQREFGKHKQMSLEKLFADIDFYVKKYEIDSLIFLDPVFALNYQRTEKFCDMMVQKGYSNKISFAIQTRADTLDKKIIKKLKTAGCKIISMGIETHSDKFLNSINKKTEKTQITDIVKTIKNAGITVRASFLLGIENESIWDSLKTIIFALKLPVYSCMFFIKTPYPGTTLWEKVKESLPPNKNIPWENVSQFSGYTKNPLIWKPKKRHDYELQFLQRFAFVVCHLKPTLLTHILKNYLKAHRYKNIFSDIKKIIKNFLLG